MAGLLEHNLQRRLCAVTGEVLLGARRVRGASCDAVVIARHAIAADMVSALDAMAAVFAEDCFLLAQACAVLGFHAAAPCIAPL